MAEEYRIPITIELTAKPSTGVAKANNQITQTAPVASNERVASSTALISFIGTTTRFAREANKMLSASGNSQFSEAVSMMGKGGGVLITALSGNIPMAIGQAALEICEYTLQQITKARQEAQQENAALINKIRMGQTILGSSSIDVSRNIFGKISLNAN